MPGPSRSGLIDIVVSRHLPVRVLTRRCLLVPMVRLSRRRWVTVNLVRVRMANLDEIRGG